MNAIDRMIGYFSLERGYRRAQYRAPTQVFAYDGAKSQKSKAAGFLSREQG